MYTPVKWLCQNVEYFYTFPKFIKKEIKLIICDTTPALVYIETTLVDLDFTRLLPAPSLLIRYVLPTSAKNILSCPVNQYANPSLIWDLGAAA